MEKPWLASVIADKLLRQVATASRQAQNKLKKLKGYEHFQPVFRSSDQLILQIRDLLESIQAADPAEGYSSANTRTDVAMGCDDGASFSSDSTQNSAHAVRVPVVAELGHEHSTGQQQCDKALFEKLIADRLTCIEAVLREELLAVLEGRAPKLHHLDIVRRNVAAHPRLLSALAFVSQLTPPQLKELQRGIRNAALAQRVDHLESLVASLMSGHCDAGTGMQHVAHNSSESFSQNFRQAMMACSMVFDSQSYEPDGKAPGVWSFLNIAAPEFVPAAPVEAHESPRDASDSTMQYSLEPQNVTQTLEVEAPIEHDLASPVCNDRHHFEGADEYFVGESEVATQTNAGQVADVAVQAVPLTCDAHTRMFTPPLSADSASLVKTRWEDLADDELNTLQCSRLGSDNALNDPCEATVHGHSANCIEHESEDGAPDLNDGFKDSGKQLHVRAHRSQVDSSKRGKPTSYAEAQASTVRTLMPCNTTWDTLQLSCIAPPGTAVTGGLTYKTLVAHFEPQEASLRLQAIHRISDDDKAGLIHSCELKQVATKLLVFLLHPWPNDIPPRFSYELISRILELAERDSDDRRYLAICVNYLKLAKPGCPSLLHPGIAKLQEALNKKRRHRNRR